MSLAAWCWCWRAVSFVTRSRCEHFYHVDVESQMSLAAWCRRWCALSFVTRSRCEHFCLRRAAADFIGMHFIWATACWRDLVYSPAFFELRLFTKWDCKMVSSKTHNASRHSLPAWNSPATGAVVILLRLSQASGGLQNLRFNCERVCRLGLWQPFFLSKEPFLRGPSSTTRDSFRMKVLRLNARIHEAIDVLFICCKLIRNRDRRWIWTKQIARTYRAFEVPTSAGN